MEYIWRDFVEGVRRELALPNLQYAEQTVNVVLCAIHPRLPPSLADRISRTLSKDLSELWACTAPQQWAKELIGSDQVDAWTLAKRIQVELGMATPEQALTSMRAVLSRLWDRLGQQERYELEQVLPPDIASLMKTRSEQPSPPMV